MNVYRIQHKIKTLFDNAVFPQDRVIDPEFTVDEITFTHWNFSHSEGWTGYAWIASYEMEAKDIDTAYKGMYAKLDEIIPKLSLISQCYINFRNEPFLITRNDKDFGFLHYIVEDDPVGLMFMKDGEYALRSLLNNKDIPEDFFLFWNDAVNTTGNTSKILLMSSALQAYAKKHNGDIDYDFIAEILGEKLKADLFAPRTGLRHRLSHGEYLSSREYTAKKYVREIHNKVIEHFNDKVLKKKIISENIVDPQRNFSDNHKFGRFFIRDKQGSNLKLKSVLEEFDMHLDELNKVDYEFVHGEATQNF